MNPYFPADEFPAKDRDAAIEGGMQVLRMIASGRSAGSCLTPDECRQAYPVVWQMLHHLQQDVEVRYVVQEPVPLAVATGATEPLLGVLSREVEATVIDVLGYSLEQINCKSRRMGWVVLRAAVANALVDSEMCGNYQASKFMGRDHSTLLHAHACHNLYSKEYTAYREGYAKLLPRFKKLKEGLG